MAKDPQYLILKPTVGWLPETEWEQLLGAAVKNPLSPTDDMVPENPLQYNKAGLVENRFEGFVLRKESLSSPTFELSIEGLGKLRWSKSAGSQISLEGKVVYVKRLKQHTKFWKALTSDDEEFKETVTDWLKEKRKWGRARNTVCLVVGLLMCQEVFVAASDEQARACAKEGQVPLGTVVEAVAASQGAVVSTGGIGNMTAAASKNVQNKTYFEVSGKNGQIFALEVMALTLGKDGPAMTDKMPKTPSHRQLGNEEENDADEVELEEMESEDWQALMLDED